MFQFSKGHHRRAPWNKGKLIGQMLPITMQEIWSIRWKCRSRLTYKVDV